MVRKRSLDFGRIRDHARELRQNMTEAEIILWAELRNRKLNGLKFLRQHPIVYKGDLVRLNYFVADFYCHEKRLIIELDGKIHDSTKEYDSFRDSELRSLGFNILRIKNEETENTELLRKKILTFINSLS